MKIGDIVMLKSGGPRMTVTEIDEDDNSLIHCRWFDASGQYHTTCLDVAALYQAATTSPALPESEPQEDNLKTRIAAIICRVSGSSMEEVLASDSLYNVSTIDSLDLVEIVMTLEEEFEIEIPEPAEDAPATLDGLAKFVQNAIK